ncbi:MAG: hypothetical protein ACFCVA_18775 [Gammaproteobacteria bacterium]
MMMTKTIDVHDLSDEMLCDSALIQAALCYLMTRHALRPCPGLVYMILHHLQMLLAHPDMVSLPERRNVYDQLLQHWKHIVECSQAARCSETTHPRGVTH